MTVRKLETQITWTLTTQSWALFEFQTNFKSNVYMPKNPFVNLKLFINQQWTRGHQFKLRPKIGSLDLTKYIFFTNCIVKNWIHIVNPQLRADFPVSLMITIYHPSCCKTDSGFQRVYHSHLLFSVSLMCAWWTGTRLSFRNRYWNKCSSKKW